VWDGGGNDTYNMSNYVDNVSIDLRPGSYSTTSAVQRAYLGDGQYAHGNIYNAYLFNGDGRSYIENGIAGSGNDVLIGNDIGNWLEGRDGADVVAGGNGNNWMFGGNGTDAVVGGANNDVIDGGGANDLLGSWAGVDTFKFDAGFGTDWVGGFTSGEDKIDFSGLGLDLSQIALTYFGDGTIVATPEGAMMVAHVALHGSDFIF
jgi:serralysin